MKLISVPFLLFSLRISHHRHGMYYEIWMNFEKSASPAHISNTRTHTRTHTDPNHDRAFYALLQFLKSILPENSHKYYSVCFINQLVWDKVILINGFFSSRIRNCIYMCAPIACYSFQFDFSLICCCCYFSLFIYYFIFICFHPVRSFLL